MIKKKIQLFFWNQGLKCYKKTARSKLKFTKVHFCLGLLYKVCCTLSLYTLQSILNRQKCSLGCSTNRVVIQQLINL